MKTYPNRYVVKSTTNIDTAQSVSYMTDREKQMVKEINLIRSNPKGYVAHVEAYIKLKEAEASVWGEDWVKDEIETSYELIEELKGTEPMAILEPHEALQVAARKHGEEGKGKGSLTHQGANGSWPWDRIPAEDASLVNGGENLVGGPNKVKESVLVLLVDSGIEGRGHRKNILNPDWEYVACYEVGDVSGMPFYWVQNFAATAKTATTTIITTSSDAPSGAEQTINLANIPTGGGEHSPVAEAPIGEVDDSDLDTARGVSYMTDREKDMVKEINLIRSNPAGYIPIIEAYIKEKEGEKDLWGEAFIADEIATARELIEELKNTPRLSILQPHEGIYTAAKLHGDEGKVKGSLDHQGADGSWPWDRAIRQGGGIKDGNENLVGGPSDVRTSVILLAVDSGIPNRGHRKTLLNKSWTYSGCYEVGTVGDMPYYWVQMFGR